MIVESAENRHVYDWIDAQTFCGDRPVFIVERAYDRPYRSTEGIETFNPQIPEPRTTRRF